MAFPEKLEKLHTILIDARNGYEEAAKDADDPIVAAFFMSMIELHQRNADEMGAILRALGSRADDSPSLLSTVHRAAVRMRAAVVGLDAKQLRPFIDGERRILADYDDALDESRDRGESEIMLEQQKRALLEKIAAAERLASASAP